MQFADWVDRWENINVGSSRSGKLSRETSFSLHHTSVTIVELSNYLLDECNFEYVMLGKFQTDPLEARFGKYRQLSGSNYNVTVTQVLENEKKLKLLSLLHLNSKHGNFQIKDLKCDFGNEQEKKLSRATIKFATI